MPRDTAGNYTLPAGNPVASGEIISASWANSTMNDLGQSLSASLDRYGRGGMLAPFQFTDGTESAPGATWSNEPTTGLYRAAYGDLRFTLTGTDVQRWTSANAYLWRNSQWEEILTQAGGSGDTTINNLVVTGSFTSPGIDDNATSTALTVTNSGIAATLTTAAQPNITSIGTLTGFTSTGIDDNATSTAITIDANENVGIGETNPTRNIDVRDASNASMALKVTGSSQFNFINDGTTGDIGITNSKDLTFSTGANGDVERMRIDSVGNVGIGQPDPQAKIDLGISEGQKLLMYRSGDIKYGQAIATSEYRTFAEDQASLTFGHMARSDGTTYTERLRIDAAGTTTVTGGFLAAQPGAGANAFAAGYGAGSSNQGASAVAVGWEAGLTTQGSDGVAIGRNAGQTTQGAYSVAIGRDSGYTGQDQNAVAIGVNAGKGFQGNSGVAIGNGSGFSYQSDYGTAVGVLAGETNQGESATAVGNLAGRTSQSSGAVAVGNNAGSVTQGSNASAIGFYAANDNQGASGVAIGPSAGRTDQGESGVSIGNAAGYQDQGIASVAIGKEAGKYSQGANSIAIGNAAGQTNQAANGIVINSSGAGVSNNFVGHIVLQSGSNKYLYYNGTDTWKFTGGDVVVPNDSLLVGANTPIGGASASSVQVTHSTAQNGLTIKNAGNARYYIHAIETATGNYALLNDLGVGAQIANGQSSWSTYSDETLKENISDIGPVLDTIKDFRCVNYSLKATESEAADKVGFIAQDWEHTFPNVVTKDEDSTLSMKYTETIPVLLKAIQEQQAMIETLQAEVAALKGA
jgi:hypothetical protein